MSVAPGDVGGGPPLFCECERLRVDLDAARTQVEKLTAIARDQAKAIAELTDECPPWAPTVATIYWLYGPTRWSEENWPRVWNRLVPVVNELGALPAAKLTPEVWDRHISVRKTQVIPVVGRPPKDATLNLELGRAKEMLRWAVSNKYLKYNPLQPAKKLRTVTRRETWLPVDQVELLLIAADDVVDKRKSDGEDDGLRAKLLKAFVLCCHDSMLRAGEALNIRRRGIGEDGRVEVASRETKNRRRRTVFLTPRTIEAIGSIPDDESCPYVFARGGVRIGQRGMAYWFREACNIAGVDAMAAPGEERIRAHDLRASGASTADELGARATAIRDGLGHASLSVTEHYLRSAKAENARAVTTVMATIADSPRRGPKRSPAAAKRGRVRKSSA